jgi:hypothetical protein
LIPLEVLKQESWLPCKVWDAWCSRDAEVSGDGSWLVVANILVTFSCFATFGMIQLDLMMFLGWKPPTRSRLLNGRHFKGIQILTQNDSFRTRAPPKLQFPPRIWG